MGLLDDAKSSVSKWFEEQVAKNKAFKAAGGMGKSNPAMTRSMGLLPATGLLEQEGDAAARADAAYGALRKEYGPLGLRPGDFVPFVSGGLAIDDALLAAAKGNYGQAAGSLAGVIPVAGAVGKVVRKITGGKSSGVIDSVKREIFAGPNAKTANKAAMKRAEARLAAGDDPATVWAQEGWGRGPDGKMRWEIDDSGSAFSSDAIQQLRDNAGRRQGRFFSNGPLHEAYPETADIFTAKSAGDGGASYTSGVVGKSDMISLGLPKRGKVDLDELRRTNTHELQHVIQDQEGFSSGGSPEGMRDEALAMLRRDVASGAIRSTGQAMNMLPMAQRNAYNRLAGEAESRLTEARIDMSPAERAAQYPWAEDYFKQATGVSKGDLIHRGGLLSDRPALSVGKADIDVSHRGSHIAPSAEFGAPLNDMTRGMYPDDFYSQNGLRYYGSGSDGEKEAFAIAQKVRGKPDAMVTAYRAVPKGVQSELYAGDWIATSKAYAKQHGESVLNGDYDIISQKVPAKHIYTNADSISEYGYDPTGLGLTGGTGSGTNTQNINRFETEADRRMAAAQRNAALPFEQGGLGLPAGNTPMQRAKAMGFNTARGKELYHSTRGDLSSGVIDPAKSDLGFHVGTLEQADNRAKAMGAGGVNYADEANIIPLMSSKYANMLRVKDEGSFHADALAPQLEKKGLLAKGKGKQIASAIDTDWKERGRYDQQMRDVLAQNDYDGVSYKNQQEGDGTSYAFTNPSQLRSRFAAFDPMRRNESDLLALNGQKTGSGLLNPEITKATNRGLYRTMLDDEEDKPSFPYGLIGK